MDNFWFHNDCDKYYDVEERLNKQSMYQSDTCILAVWYLKNFSSWQDIRKQESLYIYWLAFHSISSISCWLLSPGHLIIMYQYAYDNSQRFPEVLS